MKFFSQEFILKALNESKIEDSFLALLCVCKVVDLKSQPNHTSWMTFSKLALIKELVYYFDLETSKKKESDDSGNISIIFAKNYASAFGKINPAYLAAICFRKYGIPDDISTVNELIDYLKKEFCLTDDFCIEAFEQNNIEFPPFDDGFSNADFEHSLKVEYGIDDDEGTYAISCGPKKIIKNSAGAMGASYFQTLYSKMQSKVCLITAFPEEYSCFEQGDDCSTDTPEERKEKFREWLENNSRSQDSRFKDHLVDVLHHWLDEKIPGENIGDLFRYDNTDAYNAEKKRIFELPTFSEVNHRDQRGRPTTALEHYSKFLSQYAQNSCQPVVTTSLIQIILPQSLPINQRAKKIIDAVYEHDKCGKFSLLRTEVNGKSLKLDGVSIFADSDKTENPHLFDYKYELNVDGSPSSYLLYSQWFSDFSKRKRKISNLINSVHKHYPNTFDIIEESTSDEDDSDGQKKFVLNNAQIIYYGVPGCGKSHAIEGCIKGIPKENCPRVVFHPEYTNTDFMGQILPVVKLEKGENAETKESIGYEFIPGPFTSILIKACAHPGDSFYLIVEEINRGNAAAIFGDVFQLLDRDEEGKSKYPVKNRDVINYIQKIAKKISDDCSEYSADMITPEEAKAAYEYLKDGLVLPPNLAILATMNTSDQNVFTLDNAFQRRFDMKLIENKFNEDLKGKSSSDSSLTDEQKSECDQRNATIEGLDISWSKFQEEINKNIAQYSKERGLSSMEDKRIGCWFVKNKDGKIDKDSFANKVLKYLWDDAFKFDREKIFKEEYETLEGLIAAFKTKGKDVFKPEIFSSANNSESGEAQ